MLLSGDAIMAAVGAGVLWGAYPPAMKSVMPRLDASTVFVTMTMVAAATALALSAPKLPRMVGALAAAPREAGVVVACALAGPVAARFLFTYATQAGAHTGAVMAIAYALPILIGWALTHFWLGQSHVGACGALGFCLIIAGLIMVCASSG